MSTQDCSTSSFVNASTCMHGMLLTLSTIADNTFQSRQCKCCQRHYTDRQYRKMPNQAKLVSIYIIQSTATLKTKKKNLSCVLLQENDHVKGLLRVKREVLDNWIPQRAVATPSAGFEFCQQRCRVLTPRTVSHRQSTVRTVGVLSDCEQPCFCFWKDNCVQTCG